ncbi:MAG: HAD-IIB family hydrolase [Chloroflexota bacterium]|nr:HAD-IIB family hydrolase [Chloroflexota bacterium]
MEQQRNSRKLICTDLDGTFIGDDHSMYELVEHIHQNAFLLVFATGRHLPSILEFVQDKNISIPDACICMVGTEVYIQKKGNFLIDPNWSNIISEGWDRQSIERLLGDIQELSLQDDQWQTEFKLSYYLRENSAKVLQEIDTRLNGAGLDATVIHSAGQFLDFLPIKSSKSKAANYLATSFNIDPQDIVVCGDSGNDLDLFQAGFKGIIVGNAQPELKSFNGKSAYHAAGDYSAGIIEGLRHFKFL